MKIFNVICIVLFFNRPRYGFSGKCNSRTSCISQPKLGDDQLRFDTWSFRIIRQFRHLSRNTWQFCERRGRCQLSRHWKLHLSLARLPWRICDTESTSWSYKWESYGFAKRLRRVSLHVEGKQQGNNKKNVVSTYLVIIIKHYRKKHQYIKKTYK